MISEGGKQMKNPFALLQGPLFYGAVFWGEGSVRPVAEGRPTCWQIWTETSH